MVRIGRRSTAAIVGVVLGACSLAVVGQTGSRAVRRLVAARTPHFTARVISTRAMFRNEPGTTTRTPAITSGSGITQAGWWLFAAQDDSALVAVKGTDGSLETIRVFPSVEGADRFSEAFGNKSAKPDLEAALTVAVPARLAAQFGLVASPRRPTREAVLMFGSGSKPVVRDRIAVIFPAATLDETTVVAVEAHAFYEALRREPALVGRDGEFNMEGVALVGNGRSLRLFNRGNGRNGSVVGSVDVPLDGVLAYLARAATQPDTPFTVALSNRRAYDLGRASDGELVGITDAITLGPLARAPRGMAGEIHVLSAIAEHTKNAVHDGYTSDSSIALELPDGRVFIAPFTGVEGAESLKIEGLTVISAKWVGAPAQLQINLLAVTDADAKDPGTPSTLARVEVTFQPD